MLLVHPLVIVSQKSQNRHITFFSHFDMVRILRFDEPRPNHLCESEHSSCVFKLRSAVMPMHEMKLAIIKTTSRRVFGKGAEN